MGINELDDLTNAFNHMLAQTEQYERRMNAQVSRLALLQQITHSIGSRHDLNSIFQVVLRSLEEHCPSISAASACATRRRTRLTSKVSAPPATRSASRSGLAAGLPCQSGHNGLYRAMNGTLIYEPDTAQVASPFTHRFAGCGPVSRW